MSRPGEWVEKMRCCLIAERAVCRGDFAQTIEAALRGGVRAVQLREKGASSRELLDLAQALQRLTDQHDALLLINDRADVAVAVGADGVHLGWQSMPIAEVRRLMGADRLIGASVHNLGEAQRAVDGGADYLLAGPIFETPSKRGLAPTLGLDGLEEIRRATDLPIIALGGIDASNAAAVMRAGADGVAVIRAILAAENPAAAATRLRAAVSPTSHR